MADGATVEKDLEKLLDQEKFAPPEEFVEHAHVTDRSAFDEAEAMKVAEKLATETFTLEDFLEQMQQMKKMGSMKKMLGMLPGMGNMKQQLEDFDEREIDRTEAIIRSMTLVERRNPKILNGSRRLRIARGSGMTVTDVNQLVQRFDQAAKMMKTVARGGVPNIPGMGPVGGKPGASSKRGKQQKAKGSRSGNPAKRAAENAGIAAAAPATGSGFGLGGQAVPSEADLAERMHVDVDDIEGIETATELPPIAVIMRLARALDLTVDVHLAGGDEPTVTIVAPAA